MPPQKTSFERSVVKTIQFIEKEGFDYFIIGGLAVGVWGEARFTYDLDLDLFISKTQVPQFLGKAKKSGFQFKSESVLESTKTFGTFRLSCRNLEIDIILASTDLEKEALQRRKSARLFGKKMWFPSPEDLLLLKIIPGRPKDIMDAESIVLRQKKLDIDYLKNWARKISDEAENYRILHILQKLLKL